MQPTNLCMHSVRLAMQRPSSITYIFFSHVGECLRKGLTESPVMRFDDTILLMETLDAIRYKAGIFYPADK